MSKKSDDDNHSNQGNSNGTTLDHNNSAYKGVQDNRSTQMNPNRGDKDGAPHGRKK